MSFFGFGQKATVDIMIEGAKDKERPTKLITKQTKKGSKQFELAIFQGKEDISGKVQVKPNKKLDHIGIKVELVGMIEILNDGGRYEFTNTVKELAPAGTLRK